MSAPPWFKNRIRRLRQRSPLLRLALRSPYAPITIAGADRITPHPTPRTEGIANTTGSVTPRAIGAESGALILARADTDAGAEPSSFSPILVYVAGMSARPTIEHDPNEPKIDRRPESFRLFFVILALGWVWYLYFVPFDWRSLLVGMVTGGALILWASVRFKHLW